MKNTQLNKIERSTSLQLTEDQIVTLSDLLLDQISIQRVRLRETPLTGSYIKSLTHLRHLKTLIYNKVRQAIRDMEIDEQEATDIELAYILRAQ